MELQRKSGELRNMPRTQDIEKYRQVLNLSWTSVSCDGRCGTTSILKRNFLVDSRKGCPTDCHNMNVLGLISDRAITLLNESWCMSQMTPCVGMVGYACTV